MNRTELITYILKFNPDYSVKELNEMSVENLVILKVQIELERHRISTYGSDPEKKIK